MTLTKRGDYVVRSALCLARAAADGEGRKIREVVAEMDVPRTFASQILADLVRANLATSKAGKDGGYRLARPAAEISLLEVIEAGEGRLRAERCALGDGPCRWESVCPLHETWSAATSALRDVLADTTLAAVLERDRELETGRAAVPADSHRAGLAAAPVWTVSDSVQIERPQSQVVEALGHEALIVECVAQAYAETEALRRHLDPAGLAWAADAKNHAATSVGTAENQDRLDGGATTTICTRQLAWDVAHPNGSSSRLEGALTIVAVDPDRSELRMEGLFRPPAATAKARPDRALGDRLVHVTVRTFLRQVAAAVEHEFATEPV